MSAAGVRRGFSDARSLLIPISRVCSKLSAKSYTPTMDIVSGATTAKRFPRDEDLFLSVLQAADQWTANLLRAMLDPRF